MNFLSAASNLQINLTGHQVEQFDLLYREMINWNLKTNLTTITERSDVEIKHFIDSLTVSLGVNYFKSKESYKVIDIGSGAGFPGIPLKIVFPHLSLTLVDSNVKKCSFLEHIIKTLDLVNIHVLHDRAENIARNPIYRDQYDVVLSRALAKLNILIELCLPFCNNNGCFIALKKGGIDAELNQAKFALDEIGGRIRDIIPVSIPQFEDKRHVIVIEKFMSTPAKYPRRPGMPSKKPLK